MNYGPPINSDPDELRLRSMEEIIHQMKAAHAREMLARAKEDNRRADWDAKASGELAALKQRALELKASIDARRVHVRTEAQQELDRQRQQRLAEHTAKLRA